MKKLSKISPKEIDEEVIKKFYKNRIALKCFDCCAGSKKEVNDCLITNCSLHDIRPKFRLKGKEDAVSD